MFGARELVVVLTLLFHGGCDPLPNEGCTVQDGVATCDEQFDFPLRLPENLTELHIHSTRVKSISKNNFEEYNKLELLDLSNCGIIHIEDDAFTAQPYLIELNLAGNREFSIESTFITSDSLTKLNLSDTAVKIIPDDFFSGLPSLEELDLSSPSLGDLPISALTQLSNLSTLILLKDSRFDENVICEKTNLKNIVFKVDEEEDKIKDCLARKASNESEISELKDAVGSTTLIVDTNTESATLATEQGSETEKSTNEESIAEANPVENIIEHDNDTEITDDAENEENNAEDETATTIQDDKHDDTTIQPDGTTGTPNNTHEDNGNQEKAVTLKENADEEPTEDIQKPENINNTDSPAAAESENNPEKDDDSDVLLTEDKKDDDMHQTDEKKDDSNPPDEQSNQNKESDDQKPEGTLDAPKEVNVSSDVETGTILDSAEKKGNMYSAVNPEDRVDDAENKISEVTSQAAQSSGTNIVLGIIVTVMVVGALGFGYKYWKNRRSGYRNANTEETNEDGKELQTIVTHHTDPEQN